MAQLRFTKCSVSNFTNQLNSLKAFSSFQFEIIEETYVDIKIDRNASINEQIFGLIKLLYVKLPILLERQLKGGCVGCAAYQLRLDIDFVTKQKFIQYPITIIDHDKLAFDPMICDQKVYFEQLEQKILKEQNLKILFDVEQFGILLILHKLRNLLNQKFKDQNVIFEIMIYPSVLNFAIIKKYENHECLYFFNSRHKELFFEQNSKYHPINLFNLLKKITLKSSYIERNTVHLQQNEQNINEQVQNFQQDQKEELTRCLSNLNDGQISISIFSIHHRADIVSNGILIANRNDAKLRNKIKYISKEEEIFQVVQNEFDVGFSIICKSNILNHQIKIQDNQTVKCSCGQEIMKENFDKLIMDVQFRNLVKRIQFKLLRDPNLDSCLFKIPLNIYLRSDQYQNQFTVVSINDQILFEISYQIRVYDTQALDDSEQRNRNIFERANYKTEEDWNDEQKQNEQRNDANKTHQGQ